MAKIRWLFVVPIVLLLVALPLLGACAPKAAPPALPVPPAPVKVELPKEFKFTVLPSGTLAYAVAIPLSEAIKTKAGITMRVIPGGTEVARVVPVRTGEAHFTMMTADGAMYFSCGLEDYAIEEWGPQPLRYVWVGSSGGAAFFTRGDAGLKKVEDLKGKRICTVPGSVKFERGQANALLFGGVRWEDMIKVPVPTSAVAHKAVMEGTADSALLSAIGAAAIEMHASKHGLRLVGFPYKEKERWATYQYQEPYRYPYTSTMAPGHSEANPIDIAGQHYFVGAYSRLPEDYAYTITKGLWEGYDIFKVMHPDLPAWSPERTTTYLTLLHPYHDGTVKYFKEIKVWTPEMEAWQKKMVKIEEDRIALWAEAKKMAEEKKIALGSVAFKAFWEKLLRERGLFPAPEVLVVEGADRKFTIVR